MATTRAKARAMEMAKVVDCEKEDPVQNHTSQVELKPSLWSNLPDHLIERVLTRLPVAIFFKFRCVCKSWHNLLYSPVFLQAYAEAPTQSPWFLMFTDDDYRDGSTFDPILNKWHHIPFPSLPQNETFFPAAAAGGLVCFGCYADGWKTFVVCNPLTKAWRELPPMLNPPFRLYTVGMVVDRDTKSYKVLVAGNCEIYEVCNQNDVGTLSFSVGNHSTLVWAYLSKEESSALGLIAFGLTTFGLSHTCSCIWSQQYGLEIIATIIVIRYTVLVIWGGGTDQIYPILGFYPTRIVVVPLRIISYMMLSYMIATSLTRDDCKHCDEILCFCIWGGGTDNADPILGFNRLYLINHVHRSSKSTRIKKLH